MPNKTNSPVAGTDLVQAFQDVLKAEKTATAMESQLAELERKIDDLLASVDLPPPTALVPTTNPNNPAGEEGRRKESNEASSSSEKNRLGKGEGEASENTNNMTEKVSK